MFSEKKVYQNVIIGIPENEGINIKDSDIHFTSYDSSYNLVMKVKASLNSFSLLISFEIM